MKRTLLAALVALAMGSGSGCCLLDRLICCPRCYPMPGCRADGCGPMQGGCYGGCDSGACGPACGPSGCGPMGCNNCQSSMCDPNGGDQYCQQGGQGGHGRILPCGFGLPVPGGPPGLRCPWGRRRYTGGPQTGQVVYPYYTTRGPRDFLAPNPPSIGP